MEEAYKNKLFFFVKKLFNIQKRKTGRQIKRHPEFCYKLIFKINESIGVILPIMSIIGDDGQINLEANSQAKKAAQDAINGWDPTYGAIYYFNPNTATSSWIWSRPHVITIGNHRFCK